MGVISSLRNSKLEISTADEWDALVMTLFKESLETKSCHADTIQLRFPDKDEDFYKFLESHEWDYSYICSHKGQLAEAHFMINDALINITIRGSKKERHADTRFVSLSREAIAKVKGLFVDKFEEKPSAEPGNVKMLVSAVGGVNIQDIGKFNTPFLPENYDPEIAKQFDNMCKELSSEDPFGRLFLLHGEPGTGKSYFIRSLLSQLETLNLFIPASVIGSISGPQLIGTLLEYRSQESQPIVLIVEDADDAIRKREEGNRIVLSDILNFTDGLLGELADVRIVATTNAERPNIDEAILRDGRINAEIQFDALPKKHWIDLYKDRGGEGNPEEVFTDTKYTVAQFYAALNKHTTGVKKKQKYEGQYA